VDLMARVLSPEVIMFGGNGFHKGSEQADWGAVATRNKVLTAVSYTTACLRSILLISLLMSSLLCQRVQHHLYGSSPSSPCFIYFKLYSYNSLKVSDS